MSDQIFPRLGEVQHIVFFRLAAQGRLMEWKNLALSVCSLTALFKKLFIVAVLLRQHTCCSNIIWDVDGVAALSS